MCTCVFISYLIHITFWTLNSAKIGFIVKWTFLNLNATKIIKTIELFRNPVNKQKLKLKLSWNFCINKSWGRLKSVN